MNSTITVPNENLNQAIDSIESRLNIFEEELIVKEDEFRTYIIVEDTDEEIESELEEIESELS